MMAYPALVGATPIQIANVQLIDANGNGSLDPNECADIVVTLTNLSGQTMSGLSAVLTSPVPEVTIDPALDFDLHPIDWPSFWANDGPKADWLAEPILPAGRQVAIFSGAKVGKSLLALDIAAGLASGT